MTEHEIPGTHLPAPRKAWIHRATSGEAKDCLLFLDGELYTERVKAPAILREAEAAGELPLVMCVYLPNASAAGRFERLFLRAQGRRRGRSNAWSRHLARKGHVRPM
jgi:enterochelin esterase-like enzyme